jgi:hypothetical protein
LSGWLWRGSESQNELRQEAVNKLPPQIHG